MPLTIEINTTARTVHSKFTGAINESEVHAVVEHLAQRPDFDPTFSHIIDFSAVSSASVSTNFIRVLAQEKPLFDREARQIVVAPQAHMFALARMAQILRERQLPNIQVVRSLHEACAILGIERPG
jgi:hypothetical protein